MKSKFITLEGAGGSGKTTQIQLLAQALEKMGISVVQTREAGGTPGGVPIRELTLSECAKDYDAITEALLYNADRREHLVKKIWPALKEGKWVISDRHMDTTKIYQGLGRKGGVDPELLDQLYRIIAGDFKPDLTLMLDVDPMESVKRVQDRGRATLWDTTDMDFRQRLRQRILDVAAQDPARCVVIDANQSIENVHKQIMKTVRDRFK